MRETIYTIPVNEGFEANDECPFCAMDRSEEQRAIRYYVGPGASYMEPDVRASTDRAGFCSGHMKKLYDYGNTLGNALILQTYYAGLLEELEAELSDYEICAKPGLFSRKKTRSADHSYPERLQARVNSCAICEKVEYNMERYYSTFFVLLKDEKFREKVASCKGFCLRHFSRLLQETETQLPESQRQWFQDTILPLMKDNMVRVKEELDWLVAKYDYRNADKPWGNSQDALPRAMQKLQGIHPADPIFREK